LELVEKRGELVDGVLDGLDRDGLVVGFQLCRGRLVLEIVVESSFDRLDLVDVLCPHEQGGVRTLLVTARCLDRGVVVLERGEHTRLAAAGVLVDDTGHGQVQLSAVL